MSPEPGRHLVVEHGSHCHKGRKAHQDHEAFLPATGISNVVTYAVYHTPISPPMINIETSQYPALMPNSAIGRPS